MDWVKRQTPEAIMFWEKWRDSHPPNLDEMMEAARELKILLSAERILPGETDKNEVWQKFKSSMEERNTAKVRSIRPGRIRVWIAAAVIILILSVSGYFIINNRSSAKENIVKNGHEQKYKNDVAPGGNKAMLILADGSSIVLDSAANGTLAQQGNSKILKLNNGQLAYSPVAGGGSGEVLYNTISTPRGGEYQVVLPDGSKVWLNAASSIRFPSAFPGKERKVEISGEAYFEIMPLIAKGTKGRVPFIVNILSSAGEGSGTMVEVLGTHFNVMAYEDESSLKTTLLEGAVKIKNGNVISFLKPGQQAKVQNGLINIIDDENMDQVIAWKNGLFDFDNDVITDIMRQLSRWYDVDIHYAGKIPEGHYVGSIRRQVNVSEVLKMLELPGGIQFDIDGKKIIVMSK